MSKNGASDKVKGAISKAKGETKDQGGNLTDKAKGEFQDTAGEAKQNSNNRYER